MKIKGQKIIITQGDSFTIPFKLVASEGDVVTSFDTTDKISWVLKPPGACCRIITKEVTGITGTTFDITVTKDESRKIMPGKYEYGVYMENGNNRITLVKPTDFTVERGV